MSPAITCFCITSDLKSPLPFLCSFFFGLKNLPTMVSKYLGKHSQNVQNLCRIPQIFFKKKEKEKGINLSSPVENLYICMYINSTIQNSTGFLFPVTVSNLIAYFSFTTLCTKLTFMWLMRTHTILLKHILVVCLCVHLQLFSKKITPLNPNCIHINKFL